MKAIAKSKLVESKCFLKMTQKRNKYAVREFRKVDVISNCS